MPPRKTVTDETVAEEPVVKSFDPSKHLMKLKGKDYLEVKWRLVWLRDVAPEAVIETEMVSYNSNEAVFKARISLPNGASATGYGSETKGDFGDYLEKAETKAIGRAAGALGYGTQFSDDFEFGAESGRVVDAPVGRSSRPAPSASVSSISAKDSGYPDEDKSKFPAPNAGTGYTCEICQNPIADSAKASAGRKAQWSKDKTGRVLCWNHQQEHIGAKG